MAEVLSQDEINQLLTAINAMPPGMVTKSPDKFSGEQIRAISYIHETFAILTTCSLSAHIRDMCHVHVSSVDQLIYEEFIRSVPAPATLAAITMSPLKGVAILEISPEITFAIIDRICGGSGDGTKFQHELTDIEKSVIENIIVLMLGNLREAWKTVLDAQPQMKAIDTNPQSVRIVSPYEIIILVTLEIKIGKTEGMINICIPCPTIEPIMEKLSNWYWNKNQDDTPPALSTAEKSSEERSEHIPKENERKNFRSFDYLNRVDWYVLLNLFYNEHPQVIALVLAHMEADKASFILQNFPLDIQSNVLQRIATMDKVRLEITSEIERILENKLIALSSEEENYSIAGGVDSAVKILNLTDQYSKESIINGIDKEDHELAEEIQKRLE
jgi:flagellar motor switch protein FliM